MKLTDKEIIDIRNLLTQRLYTQRDVDRLLIQQRREILSQMPRPPAPGQSLPQEITVSDPRWAGAPGAPLTSTNYDGDSFSDTAKAYLDLNNEFGVPVNVSHVRARIVCRDSGSATTDCYATLSPSDDSQDLLSGRPFGKSNNAWVDVQDLIPCTPDGGLYLKIEATGSSTLDLYIQIWGYVLRS